MELADIVNSMVDGLYSVVMLMLLIREQNAHSETREAYRQDLRDFAMRSTPPPNDRQQEQP